MKMSGESVSVNMQQFAYEPKEMLPALSRYGGNQYEALVRPHTETVDLTGEDCETLPDIAHLEELDNDYDDYLAVGEPSQAPGASHAHLQSSSVWKNPGISVGGSVNPRPRINQINRTYSAYSKSSITVSGQTTHCDYVSSSQTQSVSFDLGNEWDDWDDFDDKNLVHASEMSLSSLAPNAKTQVQQSADYNMPKGYATTSAPLSISHAQPKPCFTIANTPLRSISPAVSPDIRKVGPSPLTVRPQNRLTVDWNKKRQSIFDEEFTMKAPEMLPKQTETSMAPLTGRFDFFSKKSIPNNASLSGNSRNSKEEEAFLGIFDGIF